MSMTTVVDVEKARAEIVGARVQMRNVRTALYHIEDHISYLERVIS